MYNSKVNFLLLFHSELNKFIKWITPPNGNK